MKTKIRNSITGLLLIPQVLACLALLPSAQAAPDPAPPPGANTRDGAGAMANITTGQFNTAFGTNALNKLTTGSNNGAQGNSALFSLTSGSGNVAVGSVALRFLTTGNHNVAIGNTALNNLVTGNRNTAIGYGTLQANNASDNVAIGFQALNHNSTGAANTATGIRALFSNDGNGNTAIGGSALFSNIDGNDNNAVGGSALFSNKSGDRNTAIGRFALASNISGNDNTAIGDQSLGNNTSGFNNVALGRNAGLAQTTGFNNVYIGNNVTGNAGESNTVRIGNPFHASTFIAGIAGKNQGSPAAVFINTATGRLGTTPPASSRRFKKEVKPMDKASEAILGLKPVTFHYKSDNAGTPQFGLIAEEVAEVNSDLVVRDENGDIYSVRYEAVNAMLLNEFLKEHRKVQELRATVAKQEATIAQQQKDFQATAAHQQKQIEALTAGLQKVSAQLETSKAAPQMAENNR